MRSTTHSLKLIALALVLGLGVNYALAWTGPTSAPPAGNTDAPINVSATAQVKNGGLSVTSFLASASASFGGNVGIGTVNPTAKLDINGGTIKIADGTQGAGKVLTSDATGLASWRSAAPLVRRCSSVIDGNSTTQNYTNCSIDLPSGSWRVIAQASGHQSEFNGASLYIDGLLVASKRVLGDPSGTSYTPISAALDVSGGRSVNVRAEFNSALSWQDREIFITAFAL